MGIKIGLLGLGQFGQSFAPLFASHPDVDSVVLCDAEADKVRRWAEDPVVAPKLAKDGCLSSLDDLCKTDCDAVVIITQPWLHAPQAIQAMESGKHVYSAVPVISIPDDDECLEWCQKIIDCSLRTGKNYMLGETTRYRPQTMFCRRKFLAGEFGVPVYAEAEYAHDVDLNGCSLRNVTRRRTTGFIGEQAAAYFQRFIDRGCKDSPMSYPTHSVSGPLAVMDTHAVKVSAYGIRNQFGKEDPFFEHFDFANVVALFQLANGVPFRVGELREICDNTGLAGEDFRMYGTRGSYAYNKWRDNGRVVFNEDMKPATRTVLTDEEMRDPLPPEVAQAFKKATQPDAKPEDDFTPTGHGGSHPYLVNEFITSVVEERMPSVNAWVAASYMAMGVAAHKSAQKDGEIVNVVDFGRPPEK